MKTLAVLLVLALLGLGLQTLRLANAQAFYDRYVKAQTQNHITALNEVRAEEQALRKGVEDALKEATARAAAARVAADAARAERDGLHDDLAATRANLTHLAPTAIVRYSSALTAVLDECVRNYQALAETADGLNNDRMTIRQAWPAASEQAR